MREEVYKKLKKSEEWKKAPLVDKRLELQKEAIKRVKKDKKKGIKFKLPKKRLINKRISKGIRPELILENKEEEPYKPIYFKENWEEAKKDFFAK